MMTVDYNGYIKAKQDFYKKHEVLRIETSPMDDAGKYHKEYIAEDAVFYEVMEPITEIATVELHGIAFTAECKFLRTEFWSDDDAQSKYYYEKF